MLTINTLIYFFSFTTLVIPIVEKIFIEEMVDNIKKKTITPIGIFFIISAVLSFGLSIVKDAIAIEQKKKDDKELGNNIYDRVDSALAKRGLKVIRQKDSIYIDTITIK